MSGFVPHAFVRLERIVALECHVTVEMMRERTRKEEVLFARFILWYLATEKLGYTKARVGRLCGYDHTSVVHGVQRVRGDSDLLEQALYIATKHPEAMAARAGA